ncbi:MAG: (2Fe-2S) ferredoxin domain-containing protein [Deltaproteobacteria bacterium]|nr:(2Fe-2S) ferredoxin domain-containing protein [Deltaproteobacteria bacterium]
MAKVTIEDLKRIKEQITRETALREGDAAVRITVHMGTSGIAAGAREVMGALLEEMNETDRRDIRIITSGCTDLCRNEPNVTVEIKGQAPVVYQFMDADKMRKVFKQHVLKGEIQKEYVLAEN